MLPTPTTDLVAVDKSSTSASKITRSTKPAELNKQQAQVVADTPGIVPPRREIGTAILLF